MDPFPSEVREIQSGYRGLFATRDMPPNTKIQRFVGPVMHYDQVPREEKSHANLYSNGMQFLVPTSDARMMNHSCDPNCDLDDQLYAYTIKEVKKGEELTFIYNNLSEGEDFQDLYWDPLWTFECQCGAPDCQGMVDRYRSVKSR